MTDQVTNKRIDGTPTKDLFVYILTRDLSIVDAINDLVDNSIDGAKRLRENGNFEGLWINIFIDGNSFRIEDNCGGIDIEVARKYAFRFGRPKEMPKTDFSIGQFGVGMKRAFFKLGTSFYVESKHANSEFAIAVSIDEWLSKKNEDKSEDWSFEFEDDFKEGQENDVNETGTNIEVTPLHDDISKYILETNFIDRLKHDIEFKHMENIYSKLKIKVNDELLVCKRPEFLVSDIVKIAQYSQTFENGVKMRIICGIGEPNEDEGGWYIFCNKRLLLGPERTELTGWTGAGGGGVASYHQQYWRFRGIVYFDSEDSYKLPWNTAKNNIDASSGLFLFARGKMIEMMKPIIKFLNLTKKDRETLPDGSEKEETPYLDLVSNSNLIALENLSDNHFTTSFVTPKIEVKKQAKNIVTIKYYRPRELVNKVKKYLKATNLKQVGEGTFDYFVDQEELDNE